MLLTSNADRRLLILLSCCAVIVTCALFLSPLHGPTVLCAAPQKCSSLALPDDSAEIAAAKASIENEASVRHQKIQDEMDNAEAQGNIIAARMRMQAAAFLARMRIKHNTTIDDPSHSSASLNFLNFYVAFLWAFFLLCFR
jgi:hypothetical protein